VAGGRVVTLQQASRALPEVEGILVQLREIRQQGLAARDQLEELWAALPVRHITGAVLSVDGGQRM